MAMQYKIKNGQQVAEEGSVVIDGVYHYVKAGYVYCNPSLNERSWNTTEPESICQECKAFINPELKQLTLF
jgi:hypothetical protein